MPKLHFSWICALGLALLLAATGMAQPTEPGYIRLARVRGQVTVEARGSGQPRNAQEAAEIAQGTVITTAADSSVILVFSNGSTVNLGPDSVLDIEQFLQDPFGDSIRPADLTAEPSASRTKLNLTRGELTGNVKTLRKERGSSFTVQTPAGAAGIRGTTFRIVFRPDGTGKAFFSLTTLEGEIGFSTTGVVDTPQALVADSQEVVIEISVDEQTGAVTVLTPTADIAARTASPTEIAAVSAAVQEVAEAVVDLVMPPKSPAGEAGPGQGGGGDGTNDEGEGDGEGDGDQPGEGTGEADGGSKAPPPPADTPAPILGRTNPDLTPGDGGTNPTP